MELLERAITELSERDYGSAIRSLEMLTGSDPMNAEAWKHLARAYYGVGDRAKAADAAQRYAALRPGDAAGHYNAGVLLAQFGQREAAERAFRAALAVDPGHAKARRALHKLTEEAPSATATPARPGAPAREGERRGTPWQGKVAAALTVVAALAIVAWLFLPGGPANRGLKKHAPEPSPSAVTTPPPEEANANTPAIERAPQPTDVAQVQPQPDGTPTPSPNAERPPIQPMPEVKNRDQAAPAARQVWRQLWQRPVAQNPQQNQYSAPGLPIPLEMLAGQGNASGSGAGAGQEAAGTGASGPGPGAQGSTGPGPGAQAKQPAQAPQPQPAQAPQPKPLFTPAEAQRVADGIDNAERQEIQGTLGYLANWLRHDPACNDEDFWPILQTALATTGPSMAPQGLTFGSAEVMANITNADNAWQAADAIEAQSRNLRSVLPQNVKLQIAQVLANATSAQQAYAYVDATLRQNNTGVSNYATQVLVEAVQRAERERARIEARMRQGN
ncbi:MAG: hypothetical protein FJX75_02380 [Armatimonadetes bacterium]|nr:hypothetical protein [Armatimonadota bacterium]